MNSVCLSGRLTKDPEVRYAKEMAIAKFTIAIDRIKEGADFPSITCFGKSAEYVEKYIKKGNLVLITGRIQTGSYEKDGKKVYTVEVVADRVEGIREKEKKEESNIPSGFEKLDEEDIPF